MTTWTSVRPAGSGPIIAMSAGTDGVWVLAGSKPETQVIFVPVAGDARVQHTVADRLSCLRAYDGCVYAAGPAGVLVGHAGGWHEDAMPARRDVRAIWCADSIYVLADRELLYFDGRWHAVDLDSLGLDNNWAGGDGRDGANIIVGTNSTHSCMARGRGSRWEPDGCGSFYLYDVRVASPARAFALGRDGLWQLERGSWVERPWPRRRDQAFAQRPIHLGIVDQTAFLVVLAVPLSNPSRIELEIFDGAWRSVGAPAGVSASNAVACRLPDGAILVGDHTGALWRH